MRHHFKSTQRGLSLFGLLVTGALIAMVGVIGVQLVPMTMEYQAVSKAVNKAREGGTVAEVQSIFDKAASIDDIKSISGKDLDIAKEGEKIVINFAYQREIHLVGPVYLTFKYAGQSK